MPAERVKADWDGEPWPRGRSYVGSVEACELGKWAVVLHPETMGKGGQPVRIPFFCGSWRCRNCGAWVAAVDWARIRDAALSRSWWLYVVLTVDPSRFTDRWAAYDWLRTAWNQGMRRAWKRRWGTVEYVATIERHASGWPHVNILATAPGLKQAVELGGTKTGTTRAKGSGKVREATYPPSVRQEILRDCERYGFGTGSLWVEVVDDGAALAGYFVKVADELQGVRLQRPWNAPKGFRRLRASRGLLPARHPGRLPEGWTGYVDTEARGVREDAPVSWKKVRTDYRRAAQKAADRWMEAKRREIRSAPLAPLQPIQTIHPVLRHLPRLEACTPVFERVS